MHIYYYIYLILSLYIYIIFNCKIFIKLSQDIVSVKRISRTLAVFSGIKVENTAIPLDRVYTLIYSYICIYYFLVIAKNKSQIISNDGYLVSNLSVGTSYLTVEQINKLMNKFKKKLITGG